MKNGAYVTLMYGDNSYFIGTLIFIISLMKTKPKYDTVLLYTNDVPKYKLDILSKYYSKLILIDYILFENRIKRKRFVDVYTKLQIFKLIEYDKILYMDNDMFVQKNIDHLFEYPTPAGMALDPDMKYVDKQLITDKNVITNAGLWLLKPSLEDFNNMMKGLDTFNMSYELEQEYVSYYYSGKWTYISYLYNFQFSLDMISKTPIRANIYKKTNIKDVYVIHYSTSTKPWDIITEPDKLKKKPMFKEHMDYYGVWITTYLEIYKSYLDKGIDIIKSPNSSKNVSFKLKKIDNDLNNKIKQIFGNNHENYEIVDKNIYIFYKKLQYANSYKFYKIPGLFEFIDNLFENKLPNIEATYNEMFNEIYTISDDLFVIGGAVRDAFLKKKPKDIDITFDSNYKSVVDLCKKNKWECPDIQEKGFEYVLFGTKKGQTLEGTYTLSCTFGKGGISRDYTVNQLVYDIKNKILIDLTRFGLIDIVNKKIRITAPPNRYEEWAKKRWIQPLRYFNLIILGLTPYTPETETFVVNYIEQNFDTVYMKNIKESKNIPIILQYLVNSITSGYVYEDGTFTYGINKQKLLPYLKTLSKYINSDIILTIVNLLLQKSKIVHA